jgi:primosomal protein N' (replication factor Y)
MAIARVALPVATHTTFDYWVPAGLAIDRGAIVRVHLGKRALTGVVVDVAATTDITQQKLQPIHEASELPPLSSDLLRLADFVAAYYQEPLGLVLAQMVPPVGQHARNASPTRGAPRSQLRSAARPGHANCSNVFTRRKEG